MMNIQELKEFFHTHLVPKKLYAINKNHSMRICIEQCSDGWEVFFSDKKKDKVGTKHFVYEKDACEYMISQIRIVMEQMYELTWAVA